MTFAHENTLILECLKSYSSSRSLSSIQALMTRPLAWSYICGLVEKNNIAPLFFHTLQRSKQENHLPLHIRRRLQRISHAVGFRNILFYEELHRFLHVLHDIDIDAILLKGAALATEVWENVSLREMADVDLLVREDDLARAENVLIELGYIPMQYNRSKDWYWHNHHHLAPYWNPKSKTAVEIHRHIIKPDNPFQIDINKYWKQAKPLTIKGTSALILSPEHLLTHLCLHFSHDNHFLGKIKWLADISQSIEHYSEMLRWDLLVTEAIRGKYQDYIYYPLYFAKEIFDTRLEPQVLVELKRETGLGFLEDAALRFLVKKYILIVDDPVRIIPKWRLATVCREILTDAPILRKIKNVFTGFIHTDVANAAQSGSSKRLFRWSLVLDSLRRFFVLGFRFLSHLVRVGEKNIRNRLSITLRG